RAVWPVCGHQLLVSQGVWLSARSFLGLVLVLVLGGGLLGGLHAVVYPGPDGHYAPGQPFRRHILADMVPDCGVWCFPDRIGYCVLPDPAVCQLSQARSAARCHGRSLEWPHAGMVDIVSPA